jgi:hypothetical protein
MHALSPTTTFICVETWLGSGEHWRADDDREHLRIRGGRTTLHEQFIFDIGAIDADVFALPMTSTAGAVVRKRLGVTADLIYVDGGHQEDQVASDLGLYSELLGLAGVIFGAEYHLAGQGSCAVETFGKPEVTGMWWLFRPNGGYRDLASRPLGFREACDDLRQVLQLRRALSQVSLRSTEPLPSRTSANPAPH